MARAQRDPDMGLLALLRDFGRRLRALERRGFPAGFVWLYAGSSLPTGWLRCDGAAISRTTYAALFDAIGTTYGVGDGSTTFNLPNYKGRVPAGRDAGQAEFDTLGETGGAKTHTLTASELPQADIEIGGAGTSLRSGADNPAQTGGTGPRAGGTATKFQIAGGGGAHNNLQPYIVGEWLIKT
jgi:microcystin-dependent protein